MQSRGPGDKHHRPAYSVAVCQCGWNNQVPWGMYGKQDEAIAAHWFAVEHDRANATTQTTNHLPAANGETP